MVLSLNIVLREVLYGSTYECFKLLQINLITCSDHRNTVFSRSDDDAMLPCIKKLCA